MWPVYGCSGGRTCQHRVISETTAVLEFERSFEKGEYDTGFGHETATFTICQRPVSSDVGRRLVCKKSKQRANSSQLAASTKSWDQAALTKVHVA
jgi:hypothetical protein